MARPKKENVDYFPHQCIHGKTMFILEEKYGNDGYSFWFKLLELLGTTPNHVIDCRNNGTEEFLQAKTHLSQDIISSMLDLLAKLQAIDPELWQIKVIWIQNFVDGIAEVYINRKRETPKRPTHLLVNSSSNNNADVVSTTNNPTTKGVSTPKSTQIK
jgi:hypothetical protein